MNEKISVLMSTYKEPVEWIESAMWSIITQSYRNIEFVIIVDDPSNADVIDLIKNLSKRDKRIKYYINKKNIGLVNSLNIGLKHCTGEYIARMDADDIAQQERLTTQLFYLKKYGYDMVGCEIEAFSNDGWSRIWHTCCSSFFVGKMLQYEGCLPHPTWLVKREIYDNLSGYRSVDTCEDYDFIIRAYFNNYKLGNVPKVLLKYRINNNSVSRKNKDLQMINKSILRESFAKKTIYSEECFYKEIQDNKDILFYDKRNISRKMYLFADYLLMIKRRVER